MSIKKRTQSADQEGCPVPIFYGQGVIQMRTSVLFVAKKHQLFQNLLCVQTDRGGGSSQCWHFFFGKGEVNFSWFCVDDLYGRSLSKKQQC